MTTTLTRQLRASGQLVAALGLLVALATTGLIYAPGLGGSFHFDDTHNLGGLAAVHDFPSALRFILDGTAGLLGRPISYASFVPEAYAWPVAPDVFLYTNICLHLLNGTLVAWLIYLVGAARGYDGRSAAWVACLAGAVWMLMPILASSSLLIVQRMTVLAATFLLLGFIGYLYGRRYLEDRPRYALTVMTVSVTVGTTLAMLAKENGALLPALILVTEGTVLLRPASRQARHWHKTWCAIFLAAPAAALLGYLALRFQYDEAMLMRRDFTGAERLLTEAHILWSYLYNAFLPSTANLGPFHDGHAVSREWLAPLSILAVTGWLVVIGAAVALRRRLPLFAFAAGWFIVGHALESTTIPLELYFEHRNYVPLIGPVFALVAAVSETPKHRALVRAGLFAYTGMLALVLFNTTSLWGRPALAAEIWAIHNPESKRAAQYLAQQLQKSGDYVTSRRVLQSYLDEHERSAGVALQILTLSCLLEPKASHEALIERVKADLRETEFEHGVFETLRDLYRLSREVDCGSVKPRTVYTLASIAAANPAFDAMAVAKHNLNMLMFEEAFAQRDLGKTMHHIETALEGRYAIPTLTLAVKTLNSAGLHEEAKRFVSEAHAHVPANPVRAVVFREQLARLEQAMVGAGHP